MNVTVKNLGPDTWPLRPDSMGDGPEEGDFEMDDNATAWIRVGDLTIHIETYDGIIRAEILPAADVMAPAYASMEAPYGPEEK